MIGFSQHFRELLPFRSYIRKAQQRRKPFFVVASTDRLCDYHLACQVTTSACSVRLAQMGIWRPNENNQSPGEEAGRVCGGGVRQG